MAVNYSALSPEELLPFIEAAVPGAQQAAVERFRQFLSRGWVDDGEVNMAYDSGVEQGRRELSADLLATYGAFLDDLFQRFGGDDLETLAGLMATLKNP